MRKTGILLSLCCALALCLALVGCGGGGGNDAAKAAFTGTWDLVGITQDGVETGADDIETLASLGLDVYLELNEDGTSKLVLFGESMEGTWTAESETAGTVVLQGEDAAMAIEGDNLVMKDKDNSLTFKKGEAQGEASTAATGDEASNAEGADAEGEGEGSEESEG